MDTVTEETPKDACEPCIQLIPPAHALRCAAMSAVSHITDVPSTEPLPPDAHISSDIASHDHDSLLDSLSEAMAETIDTSSESSAVSLVSQTPSIVSTFHSSSLRSSETASGTERVSQSIDSTSSNSFNGSNSNRSSSSTSAQATVFQPQVLEKVYYDTLFEIATDAIPAADVHVRDLACCSCDDPQHSCAQHTGDAYDDDLDDASTLPVLEPPCIATGHSEKTTQCFESLCDVSRTRQHVWKPQARESHEALGGAHIALQLTAVR